MNAFKAYPQRPATPRKRSHAMSTTTTAPKPIRVRAPNGCLKYEGFVLDPQALRRYLIRSTQELEEAARTLETRVENGTRSLCVVHAELTVCQKVLDAKNGAPADFDALLALAHPSKSKAATQVFNSFPKSYIIRLPLVPLQPPPLQLLGAPRLGFAQ